MEREVIQSVGFRNIKGIEGVEGFQFKVRLPYYRGVFLSQLMPGDVYVDGEKIDRKDIVWNVKGEDYTIDEMKEDFHTFWEVTKPAVIKVTKENGLTQGYHDIKYGFCFTSSYMPPIMQDTLDPNKESEIFMPEFGHHVNERRLLIV